VTIWSDSGPFASPARLIAPMLRSIGYRVRTKVMSTTEQYFNTVHDPATKAQAGLNGWVADYPAPSNFVTGNFTCAARAVNNTSQFCDGVTERLVRRANRLAASEPRAANDLWRQLDERILEQGAAIPLYNEIATDFVSARLGNYQYHPQWGILLDQAWVR
jgi:peptide/nickel transport system substrate-binding protein